MANFTGELTVKSKNLIKSQTELHAYHFGELQRDASLSSDNVLFLTSNLALLGLLSLLFQFREPLRFCHLNLPVHFAYEEITFFLIRCLPLFHFLQMAFSFYSLSFCETLTAIFYPCSMMKTISTFNS